MTTPGATQWLDTYTEAWRDALADGCDNDTEINELAGAWAEAREVLSGPVADGVAALRAEAALMQRDQFGEDGEAWDALYDQMRAVVKRLVDGDATDAEANPTSTTPTDSPSS